MAKFMAARLREYKICAPVRIFFVENLSLRVTDTEVSGKGYVSKCKVNLHDIHYVNPAPKT